MKYEIKVTTSLEETNVLYMSCVDLEVYSELTSAIRDSYHEYLKDVYIRTHSIVFLLEEGDYSE